MPKDPLGLARMRFRHPSRRTRRNRLPRPDLMSAAGASHEPPTATTLGSASQSAKLSSPMPPVGQKRTCGNGPASALSAAMPPAWPAGKNFITSKPRASAAMTSEAVCTPGMNGSSPAAAASSSSGVAPGLSAKRALEARAVSRSCGVSTVPRPTHGLRHILGDGRGRGRRGRRAQGDLERRTPPATSARASGTASSTRSMVITGMMGATRRMPSSSRHCACGCLMCRRCLPVVRGLAYPAWPRAG